MSLSSQSKKAEPKFDRYVTHHAARLRDQVAIFIRKYAESKHLAEQTFLEELRAEFFEEGKLREETEEQLVARFDQRRTLINRISNSEELKESVEIDMGMLRSNKLVQQPRLFAKQLYSIYLQFSNPEVNKDFTSAMVAAEVSNAELLQKLDTQAADHEEMLKKLKAEYEEKLQRKQAELDKAYERIDKLETRTEQAQDRLLQIVAPMPEALNAIQHHLAITNGESSEGTARNLSNHSAVFSAPAKLPAFVDNVPALKTTIEKFNQVFSDQRRDVLNQLLKMEDAPSKAVLECQHALVSHCLLSDDDYQTESTQDIIAKFPQLNLKLDDTLSDELPEVKHASRITRVKTVLQASAHATKYDFEIPLRWDATMYEAFNTAQNAHVLTK